VEIVQLRKREANESEKNHPRLPAVEFIVSIDNGAHKQFNGGLGY